MGIEQYDCDCDTVITMEEIGVGIEEILQYARALLPKEDIRAMVRGLEEVLESANENAAAATAR